MNKLIQGKWFGILSILMICHSCSDDNEVIGKWNLKSIETTCLDSNLTEEFETFEANGLCCIKLSTTTITDTLETTFTVTSCQQLYFKNDTQVEIIRETSSTIDTSTYAYELIDDNIEICPITDQCVNYNLLDNEIEITLPLASMPGQVCERTFTYRKE